MAAFGYTQQQLDDPAFLQQALAQTQLDYKAWEEGEKANALIGLHGPDSSSILKQRYAFLEERLASGRRGPVDFSHGVPTTITGLDLAKSPLGGGRFNGQQVEGPPAAAQGPTTGDYRYDAGSFPATQAPPSNGEGLPWLLIAALVAGGVLLFRK